MLPYNSLASLCLAARFAQAPSGQLPLGPLGASRLTIGQLPHAPCPEGPRCASRPVVTERRPPPLAFSGGNSRACAPQCFSVCYA